MEYCRCFGAEKKKIPDVAILRKKVTILAKNDAFRFTEEKRLHMFFLKENQEEE